MKWLSLCSALLLSGCAASIKDYQATAPSFEIDQYFEGKLAAWGMVQDYTTKVNRRFCVLLDGTWQREPELSGELFEQFWWLDGEYQERTWRIQQTADNQFKGQAEDIEGTAYGEQQGFAFRWQYGLDVPIGDGMMRFKVDDWIYLLDEHRAMNRSTLKKFGVELGEITLYFDKTADASACDLFKADPVNL